MEIPWTHRSTAEKNSSPRPLLLVVEICLMHFQVSDLVKTDRHGVVIPRARALTWSHVKVALDCAAIRRSSSSFWDCGNGIFCDSAAIESQMSSTSCIRSATLRRLISIGISMAKFYHIILVKEGVQAEACTPEVSRTEGNLVAVSFRLVGAVHRDADVVNVALGEGGQLEAQPRSTHRPPLARLERITPSSTVSEAVKNVCQACLRTL